MLIFPSQVENATLNDVDILLDNDDGFNCDVSEFCQENCSLCIANCNVHRLKRGVTDLIELLEADFISDCEVCVNKTITSEAVDIDSTLQSITLQLISPTAQNFYCVSSLNFDNLCNALYSHLMQVPIFLVQSFHCDRLLELQSRLEIVSSWLMNNSDNFTNSALFTRLQEEVETLNKTVLPETRKSLVRPTHPQYYNVHCQAKCMDCYINFFCIILQETLNEKNCTAMEVFDDVSECEIISITEITESVTAQLMINSGCNMEPSLVLYLRMLNILRFNYSHFIRHLQSESLDLLS